MCFSSPRNLMISILLFIVCVMDLKSLKLQYINSFSTTRGISGWLALFMLPEHHQALQSGNCSSKKIRMIFQLASRGNLKSIHKNFPDLFHELVLRPVSFLCFSILQPLPSMFHDSGLCDRLAECTLQTPLSEYPLLNRKPNMIWSINHKFYRKPVRKPKCKY